MVFLLAMGAFLALIPGFTNKLCLDLSAIEGLRGPFVEAPLRAEDATGLALAPGAGLVLR